MNSYRSLLVLVALVAFAAAADVPATADVPLEVPEPAGADAASTTTNAYSSASQDDVAKKIKELVSKIMEDNTALQDFLEKLKEGSFPADVFAKAKEMAQTLLNGSKAAEMKQKIEQFVEENKPKFMEKIAEKKDKILAFLKQTTDQIKNKNMKHSKLCDITTAECMQKLAPMLGPLTSPLQKFVDSNKEKISSMFLKYQTMRGSKIEQFQASAIEMLNKLTEIIKTGNMELVKEIKLPEMDNGSSAIKRQLRGSK